jgi:type I restriction enzyme S subunit
LVPREGIDSGFAYFSLLAGRQELESKGRGSTFRELSRADLRTVFFPVPPLKEQRAIADFLDRETTKIDALIAKKERLLDLLDEKRTALITSAVTKGLDPDVPMKESGVFGLGRMPASWRVVPIKKLWRRCDYGVSDSLSGEGAIRILTMTHVQRGEILLPERGALSEVPAELLLEKYDLLFNRTNSRDLVGKVGIYRGDCDEPVSFASYLVRIRANDDAQPQFLNYLLNSSFVLGAARSEAFLSINQANLNPTRYGELRVPLPDHEEQIRISEALDRTTKSLEASARRIRLAMDRLREYRAALISGVVTGKVAVAG